MPDLAKCPPGWYVVQAQPKREHLAAQLLRLQAGVPTFCPRLAYLKHTARGKVRFVEALFPGYLFVWIERMPEVYRQLKAIKGVRDLVAYGDAVPRMPEHVIKQLQAQIQGDQPAEMDEPVLVAGERVIVLDGPFKGFEAVVNSVLPAQERVAVLLDFLGQPQTIEFARDDLDSLDAPSPRQKWSQL
ncbi:MAG: transcription termination/antitermination NusG family protein [Verrucomicrobiota bacterium JB022]|nr:transcription termination/antitermination NusG family protein [Verrucomicrobiota bacterium JB022]